MWWWSCGRRLWHLDLILKTINSIEHSIFEIDRNQTPRSMFKHCFARSFFSKCDGGGSAGCFGGGILGGFGTMILSWTWFKSNWCDIRNRSKTFENNRSVRCSTASVDPWKGELQAMGSMCLWKCHSWADQQWCLLPTKQRSLHFCSSAPTDLFSDEVSLCQFCQHGAQTCKTTGCHL